MGCLFLFYTLPVGGKHRRVAAISGKSGPKDQVALHYYYTSPSHWCTTHEVRNCKFRNFARTISRHADGISRYSVPPSARYDLIPQTTAKDHKGPTKDPQRTAKEHYGLSCRKLAPIELNCALYSSARQYFSHAAGLS